MVRLVEALLGKGIPVKIYDRNVRMAALVGSNREYVQNEIPHLSALLVETLPGALEGSEVVIVASDDPEVDQVPSLLKDGQVFIDLFGRLASRGPVRPGGICW
ncbi:MAG: hypothetical protein DMH00_12610 [Acidobacteria bacterium]|nr:MAG: hypothetical protein DMH00_12610 [Acidobacteriota bacterium]